MVLRVLRQKSGTVPVLKDELLNLVEEYVQAEAAESEARRLKNRAFKAIQKFYDESGTEAPVSFRLGNRLVRIGYFQETKKVVDKKQVIDKLGIDFFVGVANVTQTALKDSIGAKNAEPFIVTVEDVNFRVRID